MNLSTFDRGGGVISINRWRDKLLSEISLPKLGESSKELVWYAKFRENSMRNNLERKKTESSKSYVKISTNEKFLDSSNSGQNFSLRNERVF